MEWYFLISCCRGKRGKGGRKRVGRRERGREGERARERNGRGSYRGDGGGNLGRERARGGKGRFSLGMGGGTDKHLVDNCGKMVLLDKLLPRLQEEGMEGIGQGERVEKRGRREGKRARGGNGRGSYKSVGGSLGRGQGQTSIWLITVVK